MSDVQLFLHIGAYKTGSTSIQSFLRSNQDILLANGVDYPLFPGDPQSHTMLKGAIRRRDHMMVEACAEALRSSVSSPQVKRVILSSEHFWPTPYVQLVELASILNQFFSAVKVVFYVRNHVDMWISLLSQQAKALRYKTNSPLWGAQADFIGPHIREYGMYYSQVVKSYQQLFGKDSVVVRPYQRSIFKDGDVIKDFISVCSLSNIRFKPAAKDSNESLGWKSVVVSSVIADQLLPNERKPFIPFFREATLIVNEDFPSWIGRAPCLLSHEVQDEIVEHYRNDTLILQELFPDESLDLYSDFSYRGKLQFNYFDISDEERAKFASILCERLPESLHSSFSFPS